MQALERYLQALGAQDWARLAGCVAPDLERTGPFLDVIHGRQAYVDFLADVVPGLENYELKVSRIRALADGSALVELSEIMDLDGVRSEHPEVLLFEFDAEGLIRRIDIYIKQRGGPGR
jgi:hypothetical protein